MNELVKYCEQWVERVMKQADEAEKAGDTDRMNRNLGAEMAYRTMIAHIEKEIENGRRNQGTDGGVQADGRTADREMAKRCRENQY